ncbi:MAG: hypothetical protein NTY77_08765 [Elusimicrobia bacterium]|nr:hypothetical protein [Elusimicrobiota bacterium]
MSENTRSPEQQAFIKAYNGRRRWARISTFTLAAAFVVAMISRTLKRYDYPLWIAIAVLFLLYIYFNWIRAKCPKCGRFIGFSSWAQKGLSRGFRCDLETDCAEALDEP